MSRARPPARPTQAVILAGGRGTRLAPLTDTRPKAMLEFHGRPFLDYVVEMLRDQGFERVLLLLGYLPEVFVDHFGDGTASGVHVEYSVSDPDDLTCRRVQLAADRLDRTFMLMYCDNYWPLRIDDMWARWQASGLAAQVTVYGNADGYSRDSVAVGPDGRVAVYDRSRTTPGLKGVEIGYALMTNDVIDLMPARQELFEVAVYPPLAKAGQLGAYWSDHRYYSVGGHERLPLTEAFLARRPAIIVDRDGVLNRRPPQAEYVRRVADFEWLPGALEALRLLAGAGYRVLVVSNQAGIARGEMTEADLAGVTAHMVAEAEAAGGRIDAVYHCPHGWDDGCACRKPAPGMLLAAQRDHHLDLTRALFAGDDDRDAQAAAAAGCPFTQVSEARSLLDVARQLTRDQLQEAVQ